MVIQNIFLIFDKYYFCNYLSIILDTYYWCSYVILSIYLFVFLPIWILIVRKNKYTRAILTDGWTPVLSALFISGYVIVIIDTMSDSYINIDNMQIGRPRT